MRVIRLLVVAGMLCLGGCGTFYDAVGNPDGRLQIFVDWPARTRGLPSYAESLVVKMIPLCCRNAETMILNRSLTDVGYQGEVSFWKIPRTFPDDETVFLNHECIVLAKSKQDGKGETLAVLDFYFHFHDANYYQGFNVTADLEVLAAALRADLPASIKTGTTYQLHGYAVDSAGFAMMLPDGALSWAAEAGNDTATITPSGLVTATKAGTFRTTLSEIDGQVPALTLSIPIVDTAK